MYGIYASKSCKTANYARSFRFKGIQLWRRWLKTLPFLAILDRFLNVAPLLYNPVAGGCILQDLQYAGRGQPVNARLKKQVEVGILQ